MDESLTRAFRELSVDGLVLAGTMPISPTMTQIASEVPTVAAGWRDLKLPEVDIVANDDLVGGALATRHLIELGHTRIAHIAGRTGVVVALRRQGYEQTMHEHGLGDNILTELSDLTEDSGYHAAVRLLSSDRPPTAIFAVNDMVCIGAQCAAAELKIDVPAQLSLVGYDNSYLARLRSLWLTSVDGAGFEVGRQTAHTLMARIEDPLRPADLLLLKPTLEVRGSTAAAPVAAAIGAASGRANRQRQSGAGP
jgi:DNA-binding LacI/PurR family transcriptional regulator